MDLESAGRLNAMFSDYGQDTGAETSKCGICSSSVVNRGVLDCCTHWFCFACIDDWATVTNLCPLCKARFRFITCLPVGYGDRKNRDDHDHIGVGFAKRIDGSNDDESNLPFSFPSYFIDEEAVVCMDGDACRVRAGLLSPDVEGGLAADTSVACDLCDCWYHAGCVNFDPEQSSFYCPRCIALQEKAGKSLHPVQSWTPISSEARASTLVGSLPAEKELSYGGGTLLGGTSVAIAVAEEGESAVSLSMRRIPVQASARPSPVIAHEDNREIWSPIWEPVNISQSYSAIWSPIREPLNVSQQYELWSPTPGPVNEDDNDVELLSPTPEYERALVNSFKEQPVGASGASVKSLDPMNSMRKNNKEHEVSTAVAASATEHHASKTAATMKGVDVVSVETDSSTHFGPMTKPFRRTEDRASSVSIMRDEEMLCDVGSLQVAGEQLKKGKRKALQEDERKIDSEDLPEPPRKVARKSTKKSDASEGRTLPLHKILVEETVSHKIGECQSKVPSSVIISKDTCKEDSVEETCTEQIENNQMQDKISMAEKQKTPVVESKSNVDVMDIVSDPRYHLVKDTGERSSTKKGIRTRIIMHRETDVKDTVGASLMERIRQQMKHTAGYIGGEEISKVEVSDDRFIAAFKAALARSHEKNKEPKSIGSSERKSQWLSKVMNRTNDGKGSRDSLTRKLYAGGTGRWDRDWDIAFWKERSAHLRKARKEAENEMGGLGKTEKDTRADNNQSEDPIFSRLYIADTSLFPRNDDLQPLSVQVKNLAVKGSVDSCGKRGVKGSELSVDIGSLHQGFTENMGKSQGPSLSATRRTSDNSSVASNTPGSKRTATPTSKLAERSSGIPVPSKDGSGHGKGITTAGTIKENVGLGSTEGSSPKLSAKSGFVQHQGSTVSKTSLNELTSSKGDVKKDKRQWALDVLARKTGTVANASGSPSTTQGSTSKEGQFSLLLQLPLDMRPLVPHNRHSKIPTAVRQVQLNRLVEQELKRAKLASIQNSPECEEAVSKAKAREENLYKKSNSKGVYVNLCVRSLAQTDTAAQVKQNTQLDLSNVVQKALEATGLVESPPASPLHDQGCQGPVSTSEEAKVPSKDSGCKLKNSSDKWVDNVLEMGNLDIHGDLEFNLENNSEDASVLENFNTSKLEATTAGRDPESRANKMTVILTTAPNTTSTPKAAKALPESVSETQLPQERTRDVGGMVNLLPVSDYSVQMGSGMEPSDDLYTGLKAKLTMVPSSTDSMVTPQGNLVPSECTYVPPPEVKLHLSPGKDKSIMSTSDVHEENFKSLTNGAGSESPVQAADHIMDDWMNTGKFADLDRRIESIRQNTSPSVNREIDVPWNSKRASVELSRQTDSHNSHHSVQKQVEIYVNQHLKPLYRSGVIKADQFRYAVSKTASKVMEHHENASSADFLITEGSKVRKLADQYLQAFSKKKLK